MTDTAAVYGNSLFELAEEEGITDVIMPEIDTVDRLFRDNPDYIRVLREPSISKKDRLKLIDEAFSGRINRYLLNFLKILCENDYAGELPGCAAQFRSRYNEANDISEARVTSAVKLDETQREALISRLESMSGRKIILKEKVDAKIVAGLKVELDGKEFDGTAAGRIKAIRKRVSDINV